tara:strand:- start:1382 stop:1723 length:342 start_codon:yes stop_codon:yes gene_type:complete
MDVIKYRKWYLSENWGENRFRMIKYDVEFKEIRIRNNHDRKLCIGYELDNNPNIYRPIFSHKRQRLLDKVNLNIINPYKFWNKIKLKYFMSLVKMYSKKIPIECVEYIVMFIY